LFIPQALEQNAHYPRVSGYNQNDPDDLEMRSLAGGGAAAVVLVVGNLASVPQQPTFRAGTDVVPVYATVRSDSGTLVPDLSRDDFEVRDNGRIHEIVQFSRTVVPITATLMLDMSGSREGRVTWMREACHAFVEALVPGDRVRLGTFGTEIALSPRLTGDKRFLHRVLNEEIWPGGPTPLWAAIEAAMDGLEGEPGRRVVILLTDGYDSYQRAAVLSGAAARRQFAFSARSQVDPRTLLARAQREGIMTYAVALGRAVSSAGMFLGEPLADEMKVLSYETGGGFRMFDATADAAAAMQQVADELHHQYLIGFQPTALDGRVHRLEVRVKRSGMTATARRSYVAVAR
jgi:Ca-activated chloride channel family protein